VFVARDHDAKLTCLVRSATTAGSTTTMGARSTMASISIGVQAHGRDERFDLQ
jgi:hypothetical protein